MGVVTDQVTSITLHSSSNASVLLKHDNFSFVWKPDLHGIRWKDWEFENSDNTVWSMVKHDNVNNSYVRLKLIAISIHNLHYKKSTITTINYSGEFLMYIVANGYIATIETQ